MGARCTAGQVDRLRDWINQHDDEFKTLKKNMEANSSQQQPLAIASTADQPSICAAAVPYCALGIRVNPAVLVCCLLLRVRDSAS